MPPYSEAIARCAQYGLEPKEALKAQFLIAKPGAVDIAGLSEVQIAKWSFYHGSDLEFFRLTDSKDRLFGVFVGIGVDGVGERVTAEHFVRFNSKGRDFEEDFADYVDAIAGRYAVLLDSGTKTRLFTDPMGHMSVAFHPGSERAGSSVLLTLDRETMPEPMSESPKPGGANAPAVFPVCRSNDRDVRLLPGNHMLDLAEFRTRRIWPLRNTIRRVEADKAAPVVEKFAARLAAIVQPLVADDDTILALGPNAGARMILAAAGEARARIAQIYAYETETQAESDQAEIAAKLCAACGVSFSVLTRRDAIANFGPPSQGRAQRRRLFWLRTSGAYRVPPELISGISGLCAPGHIALDGMGAEALQGGWRGPDDHTRLRGGQGETAEISRAIGRSARRSEALELWDDYSAWKAKLPSSLDDMLEDFVRIELHQPAFAVALHGYVDAPHLSPFSDRALMAYALKLPAKYRASAAFAEAVIACLEPRLAGHNWESQPRLAAAQ